MDKETEVKYQELVIKLAAAKELKKVLKKKLVTNKTAKQYIDNRMQIKSLEEQIKSITNK